MKWQISVLSLCLISSLFLSGCLSEVDSLANDMEDAWDQVVTYSVKIEKTNIFGETYEVTKKYLKKPDKTKKIDYSSSLYDESSIIKIVSGDGINGYEYNPSVDILSYYPFSSMGGYQPNYEDIGALESLIELMHRFDGEVEISTYGDQEAYKIYLTPDEDGPDWGVYGDVEIWLETEFYFPLEIREYLKEETCEIFSDFFNEQGMEIQNCFTIEKFIDREINTELSSESFDLRNEVSEETEIWELPAPGAGHGFVCEDRYGGQIPSTDFISNAPFTPYIPTYLPFEGIFFEMPSQVHSSNQDYLDENFVEEDYITNWGGDQFTNPCPFGKSFIHGVGSKFYTETDNEIFGQEIPYDLIEIEFWYDSDYDRTWGGEDGLRSSAGTSFSQSQSPFFHYWMNTKAELSDLEMGDSYIQEYKNLQRTNEYLIVDVNGNRGIAVIYSGDMSYYVPRMDGGHESYTVEDKISEIELFWSDGDNYFTIYWRNDYVHEWDKKMYDEILIVEDIDIIINIAESIQPYNPNNLEVLDCYIPRQSITTLGVCDVVPI